jgi:hypothetical protein
VDVLCPAVQAAVRCSWVWTISSKDLIEDHGGDDLFDFIWPHNMVVYRAWDPDWFWRQGDPTYRWNERLFGIR